jgi:hypothetical protein
VLRVNASNDSIVYWKRHTSIDIIAVGQPFGKSIVDEIYNIKPRALGVFTFVFGITKWERPLFISIGMNSEHGLLYKIIARGFEEYSIKTGVFVYKKPKIETTCAIGLAYFDFDNNIYDTWGGSGSVRFIYKPLKHLGIGHTYNANFVPNFNYIVHTPLITLNLTNGL